jgi:hypothetical protein
MDPPYFWAISEDRIVISSSLLGKVRFGYMGVGNNREKGFDLFVQLAAEFCEHTNVKFVMVGFLKDLCEGMAYAGITGVSTVPLTPEEYRRRASSLTYTVGTSEPLHYRLVASATFLDALSFIKPGIYLRNPYVEYYFDKMGDIGYLCNSYEEMRALVLTLVKAFPVERYRQQCQNILRERKLFEPRVLASQLRAIGCLV